MNPPRRHALLVGIDRYQKLDGHAQLRSCANDARLMAEVLVNRHGFRSEDVALLLDEAATRDGILAGLESLRGQALPGDAVVLYYSGHGSHAVDCDGDEPDGWDETLVPHDSGRDPYPNRDIRDDEIYDWLLVMSEVTRNIAVVADTCFAGGATRAGGMDGTAGGGKEKAIERDPRPYPALRKPSLVAAARRQLRSASGAAGPSGFLPVDERYVLLAACRAYEHAKELKSRPLSVFTWFLCQELIKAPPAATYRELIERVRTAVAAEVSGQTPQVEGARDRVLFGATSAPPQPFLPVLGRQGAVLELGGGAVHGVDRGSVWAVHPAGTRRPGSGAGSGLVRIDRVEAARSRGSILEEAVPVAVGDRAFERTHGPDWLRLSVALPRLVPEAAQTAADRALRAAIHDSRLLRTAADGETAAVTIAVASPAGEAGVSTQHGPAVQVDEPSWIVTGVERESRLPPFPHDHRGTVATLVGCLEDLARARNLLDLKPGAWNDEVLDVQIEIELLRSEGQGKYEIATADAGGEVILYEGDRVGLRITHHADHALYLHVLDVGLLGAVGLIYPVRGANKPLAGGRPFEVGTQPGHALILRIPEGVAARARAVKAERIEGHEALKIFLTSRETDLSGWQRPATRAAGDRLAALVDQALGAAPTRYDIPVLSSRDRWATRTISFLVRRDPRAHATGR